MCEILLLWFMGKKIAAMAENKGRAAVLFVVMLVLLWFGGEICGGIFGFILIRGNEDKMPVVYICALLGAAAGAGLSFLIVGLLPPAHDEDRPRRRRRPRRARLDDEEDYRPRRRRRDHDEDEEEDRPRRRRRDDDEDEEDRPRRRRRDEDEDEEDRPRRRRRDDGSFEARGDLP
jgi:hypothetical protein